jgi:hypothetical protein
MRVSTDKERITMLEKLCWGYEGFVLRRSKSWCPEEAWTGNYKGPKVSDKVPRLGEKGQDGTKPKIVTSIRTISRH